MTLSSSKQPRHYDFVAEGFRERYLCKSQSEKGIRAVRIIFQSIRTLHISGLQVYSCRSVWRAIASDEQAEFVNQGYAVVNSSPSERRTHPRHSSNLSIRLVHLASRRNFPCRCVDLSTAGACLLVPARMPIASGHKISLLPHNHHDAQSAEGSPFGPAVVVRVDRESMLRRGQIAIGVCFEGVQQPNTQP